MITIFNVWENTTQSGRKYWGITLGPCRIMIFKNDPTKKGPAFSVCIAESQKKEYDNEGPGGGKSSGAGSRSYQERQRGGGGYAGNEEDIPF